MVKENRNKRLNPWLLIKSLICYLLVSQGMMPLAQRTSVSPMYHLYKLYKYLILSHYSPHIEQYRIPEQARFRLGKSYTGQILNITQYTEDGFAKEMVIGSVFVDLSALYDTVNY